MNGKIRHIRHITAVLLAVMLTAGVAVAQKRQISPEQRHKVMEEVREFKHNTFVKKLDLTKEQQPEFFKLYDQMDDELMEVNRETRTLERKVTKNSEASDTEMLAAARAMYTQKKTEADIELKYFDKFAEVLTARQMLQLKSVERWIAMQMATYAGRLQGRGKAK